MSELRRVVLAGIAFVPILAVLVAALPRRWWRSPARLVEGFLAFAPGGRAEMILLTLAAGAGLGFVIVHHITRVFLVITGAPIVARLLRRRTERRELRRAEWTRGQR